MKTKPIKQKDRPWSLTKASRLSKFPFMIPTECIIPLGVKWDPACSLSYSSVYVSKDASLRAGPVFRAIPSMPVTDVCVVHSFFFFFQKSFISKSVSGGHRVAAWDGPLQSICFIILICESAVRGWHSHPSAARGQLPPQGQVWSSPREAHLPLDCPLLLLAPGVPFALCSPHKSRTMIHEMWASESYITWHNFEK